MAMQEGGWPLGLQPINVRIGLVRNLDLSGSLSFSTILTGSPSSSSVTSSNFDTESTGSFFHDRSITLGSLLGVTGIAELSARSFSSNKPDSLKGNKKSSQKSRTCFFLCSKAKFNCQRVNTVPSLGHFLEAERRASNVQRSRTPITYELQGLPESCSTPEHNTLFSNGLIAPPADRNESLILAGAVKKLSTCWLW